MTNPLVRNIVRTFSTQVGCQLIAVVSGIVVARMVGPAGKGFASYAVTAISLVTVFFFGFGDAVLFQFGKQKQPARAVHGAALRIAAVALAVIVPIFVAIGFAVPSQLPLAVAAAALPFAIYVQLMTPMFMVLDKIAFVNLRTIVQSFGTALVTIPLLIVGHLGLPAVMIVWVAFYIITAIQTAWGLRPILAASAPETVAPRSLIGEQLRFGMRAAGASAAGFVNLRIDVVVVSIMFSQTALGWYTLAIASGELLWQVSRAFVWSAIGRIGSDSFDDSAALVARLTRNTLAIVGTLGVIAFWAGPWLILHVYGERFAPAGVALQCVLPGLVAYAAEIALTNFIILQLGKPMTMVWVQSSAAAVCAGLTVLTAGHFGINAAAAATALTKLSVTVVLVTIFVRATGISPARMLLIQRDDLRHYTSVVDGMLRTLRLRSA